MENKDKVLFFINRDSFPVKCPELDDLLGLLSCIDGAEIESFDEESPTRFFREALNRAEEYDLVIPVTRNMYVRDKLRMEGVNLILCL